MRFFHLDEEAESIGADHLYDFVLVVIEMVEAFSSDMSDKIVTITATYAGLRQAS